MKISSLKCNHCGANLDINPNIKFFNCNHCGSSLMMKKSADVIYTEVLDEIKENTETLKENSSDLLIEQKIERLDRDWLLDREKYKIHYGKNGSKYPDDPNIDSNFSIIKPVIFILLFFGGLLVFITSTSSSGSNSRKPSVTINGQPVQSNHPLHKKYFPKQRDPAKPFKTLVLFTGIILLVLTIFNTILYKDKSKEYHEAKTRYLRQRRKLLDELEQ